MPETEAEVNVRDKNESLDATIEVNTADVGEDNELDKVVACSRADEATTAQKEPNSDVHAATDSSKPAIVTYVEPELEGDGMDIDKVLDWKDEIPGLDRSLQVGEQKVDITHPHDITHSLNNELFVSLQQLKYFCPRENKGYFAMFDLVWGKVRSHPWWPGQIFDPADASEQAVKHHKKDCFLVTYFGDQTFAWNESAVLKPFRSSVSDCLHYDFKEIFASRGAKASQQAQSVPAQGSAPAPSTYTSEEIDLDKYDLYSKIESHVDIEKVKQYYISLKR
ncbi:tudor/PWWP/MBT superfamily protein [Tanacetum coccineum]